MSITSMGSVAPILGLPKPRTRQGVRGHGDDGRFPRLESRDRRPRAARPALTTCQKHITALLNPIARALWERPNGTYG